MQVRSSKPTIAHIKEQLRLIRVSERTNEPFSEILANAGWSYDDLVYENSYSKPVPKKKPVVSAVPNPVDNQVPIVSFFTGCGGMDLGMEAAGYKHIAAFEINELFCKTLRRNRPHWKVFGPPTHSGDVSRFDEVENVLNPLIRTPFEGLFVGGPPCQPFSIAANQRFAKSGKNFKRTGFSHEKNGNLLFDFLKLIITFKPKAFVIENVPGLRDLDGGAQLRVAIAELKEHGYQVEEPFILNAADYLVPQQRFRLFVVGSRSKKIFKYPVQHLNALGAGSVLESTSQLPNSETREHKAESILRYMHLDYGQRDQMGRVDRLDPLLPSKTVIAGGTNGGGRSHLHPEIPRTLSVRECARLQTFPDDYVFLGPSARQFTQVGNAVPLQLAAQIGRSIFESYF